MGAVAVLCVFFGTLLVVGQAAVIRHRAAGAADLAALAAADHWMEGTDAACAIAERVARAQDTRIVRCAIEGEISNVTAGAGRAPFSAEVRARAGPAGPLAPGPPGPVVPGHTAPVAIGAVYRPLPHPEHPASSTGTPAISLSVPPAAVP